MRRFPAFLACAVVLLTIAQSAAYAEAPSASPSASASASPAPSGQPSPSSNPTGSPSASPAPSRPPSGAPSSSPSPAKPKPKPTTLPQARSAVQEVDKTAVDGATFNGRARLQAVFDDLGRQILLMKASLGGLGRKAAQAQASYVKASTEFDDAGGRLTIARSRLQAAGAGFYMSGAWQDTLAAMLAGDLDQIGRAQAYMEGVMNTDMGSITEFVASSARMRQIAEGQQRATAAMTKANAALREEIVRLGALQQKSAALLGVVVQAFGKGSSAFGSLFGAAQKTQKTQKPLEASRRLLPLPLTGRVSSPFGWRIHPVYKYRSFHTGVDLAVAAGTPIRAAAAGTVLESAFAGPYGLATVIDDGGKVGTVYAHQSVSFVHDGDQVTPGQIIGLVGCTGWCTGPHLHFEIWFEGHPVDPLGWLVTTPSTNPAAARR